jgi:hypothetical protein
MRELRGTILRQARGAQELGAAAGKIANTIAGFPPKKTRNHVLWLLGDLHLRCEVARCQRAGGSTESFDLTAYALAASACQRSETPLSR